MDNIVIRLMKETSKIDGKMKELRKQVVGCPLLNGDATVDTRTYEVDLEIKEMEEIYKKKVT